MFTYEKAKQTLLKFDNDLEIKECRKVDNNYVFTAFKKNDPGFMGTGKQLDPYYAVNMTTGDIQRFIPAAYGVSKFFNKPVITK